MIQVFGHQDQVVLQGCGGDEDVRITDELALSVEQGVYLSHLDYGVIRQ